MNKYLFIVLTALLGATGLKSQQPFWEKVPAPPTMDKGKVKLIKIAQSDTIYAQINNDLGSNFQPFPPCDLYRSTDNGRNWEFLPLQVGNSLVGGEVIAGARGTLFYGSGNQLASFDGGAHWQALSTAIGSFIRESSTGAWLAVDGSNKIVRSTDAGLNWVNTLDLNSFPNNPSIENLLEFPGHILVLHGYVKGNAALKKNLFYSVNDGQTWAPINDPGTEEQIGVSQSGALFLFGKEGYYRRSVNTGISWDSIPLAAPGTGLSRITSMVVLPSGRILCSGVPTAGLYYSDDDGLSWQLQQGDRNIGQLLLLDSGDLLAVDTLPYRSSDSGQHWAPSNDGLSIPANVELVKFTSQGAIFARIRNDASSSEFSYWRTLNGKDWERIAGDKYFQVNNTSIYAGDAQHLALVESPKKFADPYRFWWSDDWGNTFQEIPKPPFSESIKFLAVSPGDSLLFTTGSQGLFRTTDRGLHWQNVLPGESSIPGMYFHPSGRYYAVKPLAGAAHPRMYSSDDSGKSWSLLPTPLPEGIYDFFPYEQLTFSEDGAILLTDLLENNLFRSLDGGLSWQASPVTNIYGSVESMPVLENAAGHFWAGTTDGSFALSTDAGATWQNVPWLNPAGTNSYALSPEQRMYVSTRHGLYRTTSPTSQGAYIRGHVNKDGDLDCSTPDAQEPMANWAVQAQGNFTYYTTSNADGAYQFFVDTGAYAVTAQVPHQIWWSLCDSLQTAVPDSLFDVDTVDFAALALAECPLMTVDLGIPQLRRCFENVVYVNYCNQGSQPADSAWVDLELDPYLSLAGSAQAYAPLGNNVYRFPVGNILPGHCGAFSLTVYVDCDSTVIGQTHCITAHAYPDTLCTSVPAWSGAEIQASVVCQDTALHVELRNVGVAPSQALDYIIFEDDVVLFSGQEQYAPGEVRSFTLPANGHTWRVESEQEPSHPFATNNHIALDFAEGCGGFTSLGFINQFPVDQFTPSWDQDCVQSTGSNDPNDKQGFPLGLSAEHLIRPGQEIEYRIRFQNTGTDTAFTVVVRDTLSPWLNPASVRPGAASHPYAWTLSGQGTLSFTFANIALPDSNANEPASHGFISFRIEQQPNVPLGTVIRNEANIYFDFNAPVRTSQTWHTIGQQPSVGVRPTPAKALPQEIRVSPLPAAAFAQIERTDGQAFRNHRLYLADALGRTVRQATLNGLKYRLERGDLSDGLYFFRIESAQREPAGSGRLIFASGL